MADDVFLFVQLKKKKEKNHGLITIFFFFFQPFHHGSSVGNSLCRGKMRTMPCRSSPFPVQFNGWNTKPTDARHGETTLQSEPYRFRSV